MEPSARLPPGVDRVSLSIAERVMIMNKGTIVFSGSAEKLAKDEHLCARHLGVSAAGRGGTIHKAMWGGIACRR